MNDELPEAVSSIVPFLERDCGQVIEEKRWSRSFGDQLIELHR